jgi:membrane-bound lytic murein transglycosylase B
MYRRFLQEQTLQVGRSFLKRHEYTFQKAEKSFRVSRYVVAALLLIETHVGKNTGKDLVINRLSRLASVGDPENLVLNYQRLAKDDPTVTIEAVQARAQYLEDTFFPEVRALFDMKLEKKMNLFELRGSSAGAFGLPQFLPSNFLRFGIDANRDGVTSLFHEEDAILSTANFLSHHGWHDDAPEEERRKVLWKYNRSDAYVEAAINVAERLR